MADCGADKLTRRSMLAVTLRGAALVGTGVAAGALSQRGQARETLWQLDPNLCVSCGKCATECVRSVSAVKCVHAYEMCGYCRLCSGFFEPNAGELTSGAENQMCPVGAIQRSFIEDPYYQYVVDEELCIGCARCVLGCGAFGNGSLFLQVRHDRCLNCNQCRIALHCPTDAFRRVPADQPYILKRREHA